MKYRVELVNSVSTTQQEGECELVVVLWNLFHRDHTFASNNSFLVAQTSVVILVLYLHGVKWSEKPHLLTRLTLLFL